MTSQTEGIVVHNRRIKSCYFLLGLHCPQIADGMKPGQFVMLKSSDDGYPLLRRPFSIYESYPFSSPERKKRGYISILYKKVGKGTQKMTEFRKGQKVDLIGPLGTGFVLPPPSPFGERHFNRRGCGHRLPVPVGRGAQERRIIRIDRWKDTG